MFGAFNSILVTTALPRDRLHRGKSLQTIVQVYVYTNRLHQFWSSARSASFWVSEHLFLSCVYCFSPNVYFFRFSPPPGPPPSRLISASYLGDILYLYFFSYGPPPGPPPGPRPGFPGQQYHQQHQHQQHHQQPQGGYPGQQAHSGYPGQYSGPPSSVSIF